MVDHKAITDAERHEPKGISTAAVNTVYISNGAGSGSWTNPASIIPTGLPYVSGKYYTVVDGNVATGAVSVLGNIALTPFVVRTGVTINSLGFRVITAVGASNAQQAIYASNAVGKPIGTALGTVTSLSCAAAADVAGSLSTNIVLSPNVLYWYAINFDSNGVAVTSVSPGNQATNYLFGSTTLANIFSATNQCLAGLNIAQAFGTWPDLTASVFTEQVAGTFTGAVPIIKVA